jgi:phospho-N-acetylmuramoyl-pentapeptide-transferase
VIVVVAALLSWFLVGAFLGTAKRRGWGQTVRRDGPETHIVKDGTPTMGGVPFSLAIFIVWVLFIGFTNASDAKGWAAVGMAFGMYLIGLADDVLIVRSRIMGAPRGGLKAREKLPAQILVAGVFAWIVAPQVGVFGVLWLDALLFTLVPIAATNAINFTDGLDGLCAGVVAILMIPLAASSPLAFITIGALCGYLWFNAPKAQIFMGDAGSHALGGIVAGVYITQGWTWMIPIAAIIPVLEVVSVFIQVPYFQYTKRVYGAGRRIFLMTPIHHHFEKLGWQETKVTVRFLAVTAVSTAIAWAIMTGGPR